MPKITFEGIFERDNIKYIKFQFNNSFVDVPLDENTSNLIKLSLNKIKPQAIIIDRKNDE